MGGCRGSWACGVAGAGARRSVGAATARSGHGGLGWARVYNADSKGEKGGIEGDAHHGVDGALGEAGKGLTAMDLTKASGVPRLKKMSGW